MWLFFYRAIYLLIFNSYTILEAQACFIIIFYLKLIRLKITARIRMFNETGILSSLRKRFSFFPKEKYMLAINGFWVVSSLYSILGLGSCIKKKRFPLRIYSRFGFITIRLNARLYGTFPVTHFERIFMFSYIVLHTMYIQILLDVCYGRFDTKNRYLQHLSSTIRFSNYIQYTMSIS